MSGSATFVVRLDPVDPERVAAEVVAWLTAAEYAGAPDPGSAGRFPLTEPGAPQWHAGPALRALDPGAAWQHRRLLVSAQRQVCHPLELGEPAR